MLVWTTNFYMKYFAVDKMHAVKLLQKAFKLVIQYDINDKISRISMLLIDFIRILFERLPFVSSIQIFLKKCFWNVFNF